MITGSLSRRGFLKATSAAGLVVAAGLLQSCGTATPASSTAPSGEPAGVTANAGTKASSSSTAPAISPAASTGTAAASPVASSSTAASNSSSVQIGLHVPLTGSFSIGGVSLKNGAQMRVDEINGKGGVKGAKLDLVIEDAGSDNNSAANSINKLLSEANLLSVFTSFVTTQVLSISPIIKKASMPTFAANSGNVSTQQGNIWLFRPYFTDALQGAVLVKFGVESLKKTKIALIHSNDDHGVGAEKVVVSELATRGMKLVADESVSNDDKDMSSPLLKVKSADADALIVLASPVPDALIIKQARAQGLTVPVLGDTNLNSPSFLNLLTDAEANGLYASSPPVPAASADPAVQAWSATYQSRFGSKPDGFSLAHYDAVGIFAQALATAGANRARLREAIAATKNYQGLMAKYSFDANGDGLHTMVITVNKGKTPTLIDTVNS